MDGAAAAAAPFLAEHTAQFAKETRSFVLLGQTIEAHDAAVFGPLPASGTRPELGL